MPLSSPVAVKARIFMQEKNVSTFLPQKPLNSLIQLVVETLFVRV
jgi:hypothetical protein